MHDLCLNLNIDLDSIFTINYRETLGQSQEHFYIPIEDSVFNQSWVEQMADAGIPLVGAGIIPYTADQKRLVHIDASADPNKVPIMAFNAWLHQPNNTEMVWYKWPDAEPIKHLERPTIWYWDDSVEHVEIYRNPLSFYKLSAVKIDVPHTATPGELFVAISFRVPIDHYKSWNDVVASLQQFI